MGTSTTRALTPGRAAIGGAVAGPLFVLVTLAQIPGRDGFDMSEHAASFLLLGPNGWVQLANFVVSGALFIGSAVALRHALGGRARRWAPIMAIALGTGMVVAGLFEPDPAFGYPPGTPDGAADSVSASGIVHGAAFTVSMLSWLGLLLILGQQCRRVGHRGLANVATLTAVVLLVVPATSSVEGAGIVAYAIVTAAFAVTSTVLLKVTADVNSPGAARQDTAIAPAHN